MYKKLLSLLLPFSLMASQTTKVDRSMIRSSAALGKVGLSFDNEGFIVRNKGVSTRVNTYDLEKSMRGFDITRMEALKRAGAGIAVNKLSNGEFVVRLNPNLQGGGILAGQIAYWATKTFCYGTAAAAAGSIVVASGGTAGGIGAMVTGAVSGAITGAAGGAAGGSALAATFIAGSGTATVASANLVTAAVLTETAGSVPLMVATVETASTAAGAFFTMIPFLP